MSGLTEQFDALRALYPAEMKSSLVLPLLHCIQEKNGHLTEEDAACVADYLGVPAMQVIEVLSWYTMFRRKPVGRNVVKVCRNISCSLRGAERLIDHVQSRLGLAVGETTADGRYTLEVVECLASCGTAPVMQVNDTYHEQLDEAKVDQILKDCR
jgi:NADH-quinone oxidoreductase subunit E